MEDGEIKVKSLQKSLTILNCFVKKPRLGVTEISEMLGARRSLARGVKISFDEESQGCAVLCSVILQYGSSVTEVARNVQKNVKNAVESMTGIRVAGVDVQVNGIQLPKK